MFWGISPCQHSIKTVNRAYVFRVQDHSNLYSPVPAECILDSKTHILRPCVDKSPYSKICLQSLWTISCLSLAFILAFNKFDYVYRFVLAIDVILLTNWFENIMFKKKWAKTCLSLDLPQGPEIPVDRWRNRFWISQCPRMSAEYGDLVANKEKN